MKLQSTNLLHKESDLKCTKTKAEHKIKRKKIKDNKIIQVKTGGFAQQCCLFSISLSAVN